MAYTLPIDLVPGLNGALWPVTFVLLQVVDIIYFHRAGFWRCEKPQFKDVKANFRFH